MRRNRLRTVAGKSGNAAPLRGNPASESKEMHKALHSTVPLGFIPLQRTKGAKPVLVNIERICAYSESNGVTWLALQGRSKLLWVREEVEEISAKLREEQKRLRGE